LLLLVLRPARHQKAALAQQSLVLTNPSNQPEQARTTEHRQITNRAQIVAEFSPKTPLAEAVARTNPAGAMILSMWQAPIEFYGKVIDESSNAVAGANVVFHWMEIPDDSGSKTATTESDVEGLFSLHGQRGPSLSVSVSKEGYYPRKGGAQYGSLASSEFSPDPQNPVTFVLRKKGQGAELTTSQKVVRVPTDNTPVRVDLLEQKAGTSSQLEIRQVKPPWQEATNWSFRMSIPDGGLVENQDEFQFEAPETNYQPSVEYHFTKSETNWITQVTEQFYFTFGKPRKYGWLRIESNLGQETVFLTYAINPTGSRNLEPLEAQPQHRQLPPGVTEVIPSEFK
jgi:hypothetical protein